MAQWESKANFFRTIPYAACRDRSIIVSTPLSFVQKLWANPRGRLQTALHEQTRKYLLHLCCVYRATSLACLVLAAFTACSRQRPLTRDELQSKLRAAASIAAETSTFVDFVRQNRATYHYAQGHIEYLSSELRDVAKDLSAAIPPPDAAAQLTHSRSEVQALAAVIIRLRGQIDRRDELAREQAQIAAIRKDLEHTISSL